MTNPAFKRYSDIAAGRNKDHSDEYYTLYYAFMALVLELVARYKSGKKYKVIICPCDSKTSVFRHLEEKKEFFGSPKIIYSFYPEKDWAEYFDLDFEKEYGCLRDEVLIFTNPPFRGLSKALEKIKCDYLLFGSNSVDIGRKIYLKECRGFLYKKNNNSFKGSADDFVKNYGGVNTFFYSNKVFLSHGRQYINESEKKENVLFGKDRLKRIK